MSTHELSGNQRTIVELIAKGMTNKAIARQMNVTEKTVATHVMRACEKLDVRTRTQLAVRCAQVGGAVVGRVWNPHEGLELPALWATVGPAGAPENFTIYNVVKA